jgi:hypothetical protein
MPPSCAQWGWSLSWRARHTLHRRPPGLSSTSSQLSAAAGTALEQATRWRKRGVGGESRHQAGDGNRYARGAEGGLHEGEAKYLLPFPFCFILPFLFFFYLFFSFFSSLLCERDKERVSVCNYRKRTHGRSKRQECRVRGNM